jgi:DNA-binding GntR family transcriptional regulator
LGQDALIETQSGGETAEQAATASSSSSEYIVGEVLRGLCSGSYVPGQRLVEADLIRDYKVSRGSLREALKRLATEGVVSLSLHRGAYIRALSRSETRDVFAVIEALTELAARLAAEHIGEPENAALMRDAVQGVVNLSRPGIAFIGGWFGLAGTASWTECCR